MLRWPPVYVEIFYEKWFWNLLLVEPPPSYRRIKSYSTDTAAMCSVIIIYIYIIIHNGLIFELMHTYIRLVMKFHRRKHYCVTFIVIAVTEPILCFNCVTCWGSIVQHESNEKCHKILLETIYLTHIIMVIFYSLYPNGIKLNWEKM